MDMDSNDVGLTLLIASVVPLGFGGWLAYVGLSQVKKTAKELKRTLAALGPAVHNATAAVGAAQAIDGVREPQAAALAATNAQVASAVATIPDQLSSAQDALAELKGPLAAARAFLAIALLLIVASLTSFGLVDISISDDADEAAATSVVQSEQPADGSS